MRASSVGKCIGNGGFAIFEVQAADNIKASPAPRRRTARELPRGAPVFPLTAVAAQPTRHEVCAIGAPTVIRMGASLLVAPIAPLATPFDEVNHQRFS